MMDIFLILHSCIILVFSISMTVYLLAEYITCRLCIFVLRLYNEYMSSLDQRDNNTRPIIRLAVKEDCGEMLDIYAPYVRNTVISFEYHPPALHVFERRFETFSAQFPWLVIEEDGVILGYAYAHRFHDRAAFDWTVECSIYMREDHRGSGLGRALYTSLIETLKLQGVRTAFASICVPNQPSEALHKAFGFVQKGLLDHVGYKNGAWRSIAWYALKLTDRTDEPETVRPIGAVSVTPEFKKLLKKCAASVDNVRRQTMKVILGETELKDGRRLVLRTPDTEDAEQMLAYINRIGGESNNLLFGKNGFSHMTLEQEKQYIESLSKTKNALMVVGEIDNQIVSVSQIRGEASERIAHNFELSISVSRDCWNIGVGSAAMKELIRFAESHGAKNILLGVKASNISAIRMYEKFGFVPIGVHRNFFNVNGVFDDEILMDLYID